MASDPSATRFKDRLSDFTADRTREIADDADGL